MAGHPVPTGRADAARIDAARELLLWYRPSPRRGPSRAAVEALIAETLRRLAAP